MVFHALPPPIHAHAHTPAPAPMPPKQSCADVIGSNYPVYVFVNNINESEDDATATAKFSQDPAHFNPCVTISNDGTIDLTKYTKTSIPIYFYLRQSQFSMAGKVVYSIPPGDDEFRGATIYSDGNGDDTVAKENYNNTADGSSHYYSISICDDDNSDCFVIDPKIQNQPPQLTGRGTPLLIAIGVAIGGAFALFGVYLAKLFRRRRR